jgi:hypothetical protein
MKSASGLSPEKMNKYAVCKVRAFLADLFFIFAS